MPRATEYLQRKATEKAVNHIPAPVLDAMGRAMLKGIDKAVESRWDRARDKAAEAKGATVEQRARSVTRSFSRELSALGAATGATAAAPGIGTASAVSMLAVEVGWFALRAADLIMTLGAVHGHVEASAEERRAWVLSVLAFGDAAAGEFAALVGEINRSTALGGERVGALMAGVLGGDAATIEALREINRELAVRVATRYGSRMGPRASASCCRSASGPWWAGRPTGPSPEP